MGGRGPTGWDVARAAGVSQSTVSLVLSGRAEGRVGAATRQRVLEAARALGYRPDAAARSLRRGRSGLVLLMVPEVQNPFFARVMDGAEQAAHERDCAVVLSSGRPDAADRGGGGAVDGVLVCSQAPPAAGGNGARLPTVLLDHAAPAGIPSVRFDLADGMRQVVGHLTALGHTRLGYLRSPVRTPTFTARSRAFARATAGLVTRTVDAALSVDAAEQAAGELLSAPGPGVTAVVCDDDVQAAGVYRAARRRSLRVPEELSVVGFGNTFVSRLLDPTLTTVELPGEELGRAGLAALLALLDAQALTQRSTLPVTLQERDSTAPPATLRSAAGSPT